MPELPEVEYARRQLLEWSAGAELFGIRVVEPSSVRSHLSSRSADAVPDAAVTLAPLVGSIAGDPQRHGKRLGWPVGRHFLLAHLGMSGKWVRRGISDPPPRFGRVGLEFRSERGSSWACWFVDTRRFGCLALGVEADLHRGLGPDCLLTPLSGSALAARFPIRRSIKVALLEQDRIAGLGNIHAAEALWLAGIHPAVACDRLSAGDWDRLAAAIVRQVHAGIASFAGQLEVTYLSEGLEESRFFVYGREALPCQTCGSAIQREVQVQRGTWWCPTCQPDRGRDAEPRTG